MIINVVGVASMVNVIDGYGSVPVPGEYDFFVNNIEQIRPWLLKIKKLGMLSYRLFMNVWKKHLK